jgi:hypothetical protein
MSPASASLFDVVAITAVAVVLAVVLLVFLMRRAAAHPYRALDFLLSPAEVELLAALRQGLGADYEVYPKVRLADLVDVRKGLTRKQRAEALAHVESRHVAFVVCDRETSAIRGVVEPEPATARRPGRHRQVPFLDAALAAAQVPLVRVPAQSPHSPAELRDRVLAALGPAAGGGPAEPGKLGYFGPATDALRAEVGGRGRAATRGRERDDGPGSAATWLPTRGVLAVAAVLLILGAVLSWLVERPAPASRPTQPPVSTAPPPASAEPAPAAAAPPAEVAPAPEKPREIVGYRDVRVPGKPLAECMGPDREIGPEVLRCRDGYTKREPIYR